MTRPVKFSLVVDDFCVKYVGEENLQHLINAIQTEGYKLSIDWSGTKYKWESTYYHNVYLLSLSSILRVPTPKRTDTADWLHVLVRDSNLPNIARILLDFANLSLIAPEKIYVPARS